MKNMILIVNLTQAWVHKKFNDNFVEQWMARPGKWNRTVPGSPKSHESTQLVENSVIHPSNDKVKIPTTTFMHFYDGIFCFLHPLQRNDKRGSINNPMCW